MNNYKIDEDLIEFDRNEEIFADLNVIDTYHVESQFENFFQLSTETGIFESKQNTQMMINETREILRKKEPDFKAAIINLFDQEFLSKIDRSEFEKKVEENKLERSKKLSSKEIENFLDLIFSPMLAIKSRERKLLISKIKKIRKATQGKETRKRKSSRVLNEEVLKSFQDFFERSSDQNSTVTKMKHEFEKEIQSIKNIGRTTFYEKVIRQSGYRFKYPKLRFGKNSGDNRDLNKLINWNILTKILKNKDRVLFYDESTFVTNSFNRRMWHSKGRKEILRIHKPGLRVKLNMLISVNEIFSF